MPRISVILPNYNGEKFIRRALESLLWQDFTDFEVLVLDDGSTDTSKKIITEFCDHDNRIKLYARPRSGLIDTLNFGLSQCSSEFIARMDADDVCIPTRFSQQVEFLDENHHFGLLGTGTLIVDEYGQFQRYGHYPSPPDGINDLFKEGSFICHPSVMMRSSLLDKVNGYDQRFIHAEDYGLWSRLIQHTKAQNLPSKCLIYTQHTSNVSFRNYPRQLVSTAVIKAELLCGKFIGDLQRPVILEDILSIDPSGEVYNNLSKIWFNDVSSALAAGWLKLTDFDEVTLSTYQSFKEV